MSVYIFLIFTALYFQPCHSQEPVSYLTGDPADVTTPARSGLLLMGGSTDVDSAVKWFLQRAAGGDVVVIRARGADGYNSYMYSLAPVNSVETIVVDSREKAGMATVAAKIRGAEALFIAGGDQSNYVNFWINTATQKAINYLINTKKVMVGGTSAGLAILGSAYYSAQFESATSSETLADPYTKNVTLGDHDFLSTPFLVNTITDSHYTQRDRQGRHISFMARIMKDFGAPTIKGIGIDEKTALCIDDKGMGKVFGTNKVYFFKNSGPGPENCTAGQALNWNRAGTALQAYIIAGTETGNGNFNALDWSFSGGITKAYYVNNGNLISD